MANEKIVVGRDQNGVVYLPGKKGAYRTKKSLNDEVPAGTIGYYNGYDIWYTTRSLLSKPIPVEAQATFSVNTDLMEDTEAFEFVENINVSELVDEIDADIPREDQRIRNRGRQTGSSDKTDKTIFSPEDE